MYALNNGYTRLGYEANTANTFVLSDLTYRFLPTNNLAVLVGARGVNAINVFRDPNRVEGAGSGLLSLFAQRNPIIGFNVHNRVSHPFAVEQIHKLTSDRLQSIQVLKPSHKFLSAWMLRIKNCFFNRLM